MVIERVRSEMSMDEQVIVAVFLRLVHVLGRRHRHGTYGHRKDDPKDRRPNHSLHRSAMPLGRQLKSR
jgi:hypothetical protein